MKKLVIYCFTFFCTYLFTATTLYACTDIRLKAADGTWFIARSMEFAADMHSNLMSSPRDRSFTSALPGTPPTGKIGLAWKSQYGYVFLDAFNTGVAVDGLNEMGLAVEALYLPGETQYMTVPAGKENQGLLYLLFVDWVLGNFKSVDEVQAALKNIFVYSEPLPQLNNMVFPLHFNIVDNTGKAIVVEFTNGQMQVYNNDLGVMTNSPTYDWHITNLRNFLGLSPINPQPVIDNGITFVATGQGSGMIGLPGDISPPSRFVKMATMLRTVIPAADATGALNLAQHIINNVDIPLGFVREVGKNNTSTNEMTQWVVFKDLTHKRFYYRTYNDLALRMVDLTKVNFAPGAPQAKMPISNQQFVIDMSASFSNNLPRTNG